MIVSELHTGKEVEKQAREPSAGRFAGGHDLGRGDTVVVNGSREHLAEARKVFPQIEPVHVAAATEALRARLAAHGRESPLATQRRMERNAALAALALDAALEVANEGPIEYAGRALVNLILRTG